MNTNVMTTTAKTSIRHPRTTFRIASTAAKRPILTIKIITLAKRTSGGVEQATSPAVKKELRAAVESFVQATNRARRIGVPDAIADRKVAKGMEHGIDHLSKALDKARGRKRHRMRKAIALVTVAAVSAGGVYSATHRNGHPAAAA